MPKVLNIRHILLLDTKWSNSDQWSGKTGNGDGQGIKNWSGNFLQIFKSQGIFSILWRFEVINMVEEEKRN